jgi:O-antigen ligase
MRYYFTHGYDPQLFVDMICLFLLFFVLMQISGNIPLRVVAWVFLCFAVTLSLHGVLQYLGRLPSENTNFKVTGSFDNPTGFASALAFMIPYGLYLLHNTSRPVKYLPVIMFVIVSAGILLSGSRAAAIACIVVAVCYVCSRYSGIKFRKWMPATIAVLFIASVTVLYFMKKDSADGRLLIWQCTWNMIKDRPITGHGQGAFQAKYMLYQADYFETQPNSRYASLSDNVLHPFSEYLLILSEYGIAGLCILVLQIGLLVRNYLYLPGFAKYTACLSLVSIAIVSCFSYPFHYPFTWFITFLNIAVVCTGIEKKTMPLKATWVLRLGIMFISGVLLYVSLPLITAEILWKRIARASLAGITREMLPQYNRLYKHLGKNGLFLYNHAAELNYVEKYEESLRVFEKCTEYYNDMDVQMLMADNYEVLELYDKAEQHLKFAANMCPNRFMPLYELVKLYDKTGHKEEALILARHIAGKEIKVFSPTVMAIKNEMQKLIQQSNNMPMER